jgi:hypothetical protein
VRRVRAAAHVHSSWSYDASWSLQDIAAAFSRRRYDVVLMSEHDRNFDQHRWEEYQEACLSASSSSITLIPGIEYEDGDHVVHTPVWGGNVPFLDAGRPTLELLGDAAKEGAVAVLAHPWRRNAIARYQPEWAPLLSAIEIWNRKYDGIAPNRQMVALAERENLNPFVSLDFHDSRQFFPLAMSMTLDEAPTAVSIAVAIRSGRFQPEFIGRSVFRFTGGLEEATLHALEATRRALRRPLRGLRKVRLREPSPTAEA